MMMMVMMMMMMMIVTMMIMMMTFWGLYAYVCSGIVCLWDHNCLEIDKEYLD
jgi:hypothetical protein